ncbi:PDZ domain-containing protein [Neptunicella sp. SCSIO 80796]|uniref:PDZ domain-containing protein n=1 Tax=Neptunicella plasticusilytica TaxID=3117012 RepID=UPI003A4DD6A7
MQKITFTILVLLFLLPLKTWAKGSIGMGADVSVDGIFSPEVVEFKVKSVVEGSAADKAGVTVGQLVIAIDGCKIPGCSTSKAQDLMDKETGDILPLLIRNKDGSEQLLTIHVE